MTEQQQAVVQHHQRKLSRAEANIKRRKCKANEIEVSWAKHSLWRAQEEAAG